MQAIIEKNQSNWQDTDEADAKPKFSIKTKRKMQSSLQNAHYSINAKQVVQLKRKTANKTVTDSFSHFEQTPKCMLTNVVRITYF